MKKKKKDLWSRARKISIDEVSHLKGRGKFVTVICNIETGELLEVINSHKQEKIAEVLMQLPLEVREGIEEVSIDMWAGFQNVVKKVFVKAIIVFDRFHVMSKVTDELNEIRKQTGIKEKNLHFVLLKNECDLSENQREILEKALKRSKRLKKAYKLKEEFRKIYEKSLSVEEAKEEMNSWLEKACCIYASSIATIRNHFDGICNYFKNRTTSGVMEGINNRIKLIKRMAYGFRNFTNFRARLLACFNS